MRRISLFTLITVITGCTTIGTGSMNAPGPSARVSYTAVDNSRMLYTGVDVEAINAAIAADEKQYRAPEDEVLQQSMDEDLSA